MRWWINPRKLPPPKVGDMATFGGEIYVITELREDEHSAGYYWVEITETKPVYKLQPVEQAWE